MNHSPVAVVVLLGIQPVVEAVEDAVLLAIFLVPGQGALEALPGLF